MDNIDLQFIKKTDIMAPRIPVGIGNQEPPIEINKERMTPVFLSDPRKTISTLYNGSIAYRYDSLLHYMYSFDYQSGVYKRTDFLTEQDAESGVDVFAANFPHLIDIGIMGHCSHGKSGLCMKSGVQCYQNGIGIEKPNMAIEAFERIANECKDLTNQFALGGRGDPNEHEHFGEILWLCRENNIVPNYTTSGFLLTDEQIALSKKYCGAVAVSWYRNSYTMSAINRLIAAGVKTNIHYVLNIDTIDEAVSLLETDGFPEGTNAVVFLTHKPVGLGQREKSLRYDDPRVHRIYQLIRKKKHPFKVGVDGCFVVGMITSGLDFNMKYLDTCEAARFTCYIDSELKMKPCSFDVNDEYAVDISNSSIMDGWNSDIFKQAREHLLIGCPGCSNNAICHGGCFIHKDIVLCPGKNNKEEQL